MINKNTASLLTGLTMPIKNKTAMGALDNTMDATKSVRVPTSLADVQEQYALPSTGSNNPYFGKNWIARNLNYQMGSPINDNYLSGNPAKVAGQFASALGSGLDTAGSALSGLAGSASSFLPKLSSLLFFL